MTLTAGVLSQVSVAATTASAAATAATGGTSPYTYQWYMSTTTGFTPGGGNIISGATALTVSVSGLIPNTVYYFKVVATDTGHSNDTVEYTQLAVTTTASALSPNQFAETTTLGMIDMRFPYNSISVLIDTTQATALYPGSAVKMVDSSDGVPKVVGMAAEGDSILGFINYDAKNVSFVAGNAAEISMAGNVMYLYATAAIARGVQVTCDITSPGGVHTAAGNTGDTIVGWALDKATAAGQLIRVFIKTPSFTVV